MGISRATASWTGALKGGTGVMKPAHAGEAPFSVASRFEGQPSSNPEELVGAALAGCFSMALASSLGKEGLEPESIETKAAVHLEKKSEGFTITQIELTTHATVPNVDAERFERIAQETKKTCPVSRALAGTTITLTATLDG